MAGLEASHCQPFGWEASQTQILPEVGQVYRSDVASPVQVAGAGLAALAVSSARMTPLTCAGEW